MNHSTSSVLGLVAASLLVACGSSTESSSAAPAGATPPTAPAAAEQTPPAPSCPSGAGVAIDSGKIVARVSIDGRAPIKAVLDTGASVSVFRKDAVTQSAADVTVAGRTIHLARATVSDDVIASLRMPDVHAVLGGDVFAGLALTVDYPRSVVMLDDAVDERALAACAHVAAAHDWVPFTVSGDLFVRGSMEGKDGWLLLDTGASLGVVTESTFTALSATRARPALTGFYTPAAVGTFWAKLTTLDSITVGGLSIEHVVARTIEDDMIGNAPGKGDFLGVVPSDFFAHTMVTFDYAKKRLRLAPAKDDPTKLPSRFFPIGIGLEERLDLPVHVGAVLAGSAAADAAIAVGDEIVEVAGRRMADLDAYTRAWTLVTGTPKAQVVVKLRHEGVERVVTLESRDLL